MQENNYYESYKKSISANELLQLFLRNWKLSAILGVAGAVIALIYSTVLVTPKYISTARLYIMNQETENVNTADISISTQISKDFIQIIDDIYLLESVSDTIDGKYTARQIKNFLSFELLSDTRVIEIKVSSPDAESSKAIGDAVCTMAKEKMIEIVGRDNMRIVREASIPQSPTKPNAITHTIAGLFIGVLLGCGISVLIYLIDNKISSSASVEKYLGLSVLATIPYK